MLVRLLPPLGLGGSSGKSGSIASHKTRRLPGLPHAGKGSSRPRRRFCKTFLVTKDTKKRTLVPTVESKVLSETMVYTDEYRPYEGFEGKGYKHDERVPHAEQI